MEYNWLECREYFTYLIREHWWAQVGLVGFFTVLIEFVYTLSVPENIPPFPARAHPVVGHLPLIWNKMRKQMNIWTKSTGEIFSVYFGNKLVVVLNSYDVLYKAFVTQADVFSDRPPPDCIINADNLNKGIINTSGDVWREQRTVTHQILQSLAIGENVLAEKVGEEVTAYLDALGQEADEPMDLRELTFYAVSNSICAILTGKRFDYGDPDLIKLNDLIDEELRLLEPGSVATSFPLLQYLPGDWFGARKLNENFHELHSYFRKHFMRTREDNYDENNRGDFISSYLFEIKKAELEEKTTSLSRFNLSRVLDNLFGTSSQTVGATLLWFMVYMINFPEVQAKVFKEINDVVGTERAPVLQDRSKLNYTNAVILETQRLASVLPMSLYHYTYVKATLKDFTIPENTLVIANLDAILHCPDTWKDPLEFRPQRFLDAQGFVTQPEQFLVYSLGRRACMGEALARLQLYLFVCGLVQKFELLPAEPGKPPLRKAASGVICPPVKFKMRLQARTN